MNEINKASKGKKLFIGITVLDDENNALQALGLLQDTQSSEIQIVNTANLSEKTINFLLTQAHEKTKTFLLKPKIVKPIEIVKIEKNDDIL